MTIVYLADYFDEKSKESAAKQLMCSLIQFVEALSPFVIASSCAEELFEMAMDLLEEYE